MPGPESAFHDHAASSVATIATSGSHDGRWSLWAAERRAQHDTTAGFGPGSVIDLTGPEALLYTDERASVVPANLVRNAAAAIVVLNVLDIVTTRLALSQGASEGNPLTNLFVHHLWLFILIKVGLPGLVSYRLWSIRDRVTPVLLAGMWWVVGVYSMVIILNALHLLR